VKTAFVLGGGGMLGAYEVGMLRALAEARITPDVVVGTSVGAINGVFLAADPAGAAAWLAGVWESAVVQQAFSGTIFGQMARLARSGTHLHSLEPLRRMLERALPGRDFADLRLPFHCVAASIERALGADRVYVLHVGRIERPLLPPRRPWEVGLVAFEIARRHRFHEEMAALPGDVRVHVLPSGADKRPPDLSQLRYRDNAGVGASIERAYQASAQYLAGPAGPHA